MTLHCNVLILYDDDTTLLSQDLFSSNKENEEIPVEKPRMKIGKLDPRNLFDKGEREAAVTQQEKENFNNIVIGKLNTKNIFESEQENRTLEKQSVRVGKLKTKVRLNLLLGNCFIFLYLFSGGICRR